MTRDLEATVPVTRSTRLPIRAVVRFVAPGGLLAVTLLALPALPGGMRLAAVAPFVGAAALLIAAALGWRFGRGRLIHGAAIVALTAALPLLPPDVRPLGAALVPINLALLAVLPDRGTLSAGGLLRSVALALQVAFLLWLGSGVVPDMPVPLPGAAALPHTALAAGLALAILAGLGVARDDALVIGSFWAAATLVATGALPLGAGLSALAPAPFLWPQTAALLLLIVAAVEEAHRLAYHDGLTGLPSRRALDERLPRMVGRYTVAMVDVDHFKKFNDRHGHDVGDQILRMVAARLRETPGARAYRYGGEEFTLVFRGTSLQQARSRLEDVRAAVGDRPFVIRGPDRPARKPKRRLALWGERQELRVTVSLGAAERSGWRHRPEEVLKEADQALYRAKKRGRNRVVA